VRAQIIAQTVGEGSDLSLKHSAAVLAQIGYAPGAQMLRALGQSALLVLEASATRRQTYLNSGLSPEEQRKRLAKTYRRRNEKGYRRREPSMPEALTAFLVGTGEMLHGLAPENERRPAFSFAEVRGRLEALDDGALLGAYEEAGRLLPRAIPFFFQLFNMFMIPLLALRFPEDKRGSMSLPGPVDIDALLAGLRCLDDGHVITPPGSPAGALRLFTTFLLATVPQDDGVVQQLKDFAHEMLLLLSTVVGRPDFSDLWEKGGASDLD
jgi:hypothetical protein